MKGYGRTEKGIANLRVSAWLLFGAAGLLFGWFLLSGALAGRWNEQMNASDVGKLVMAVVAFLAAGLLRGHVELLERVLALEKAHEEFQRTLDQKRHAEAEPQ